MIEKPAGDLRGYLRRQGWRGRRVSGPICITLPPSVYHYMTLTVGDLKLA